jgi:hypothetical protein
MIGRKRKTYELAAFGRWLDIFEGKGGELVVFGAIGKALLLVRCIIVIPRNSHPSTLSLGLQVYQKPVYMEWQRSCETGGSLTPPR